MAEIYTLGAPPSMPKTDREQQEDHQEQRYKQTEVMAELERYAIRGTGLATMALSMWKELEDTGLERHEMLAIVTAALGG
jgi:hypothetical protein